MATTVTVTEEIVDVTVTETTVTANVTEQTAATVTVDTGVTDHGALTGLNDDDHTQYLLKAGGTMTGDLILAGDPSVALEAATKQYVDNNAGGASDVGDLTTVGLTAGNMLRVAVAGGLEERTPAQVLADIGAAASGHNHDASYVNVSGDTMTGDLSLAGDALSATIRRIDFVNDSSVVARIEAFNVSGSNKQNAELVFSTSLNGSFSEVLRLPRPNSNIVFARPISLVDEHTILERTGVGSLRLNARLDVGLYSALFSQNYAYFSRENSAYIAPRTANTNTIAGILQLRHNTSNTPAAGFGAALDITLESSTTEDRSAARIAAVWQTATDASRKADLVLSAFDTAEREFLRGRGTGTAAAIGFLGADPAVQQAHIADPTGGTREDTEARAAINDILDVLETFGLVATS